MRTVLFGVKSMCMNSSAFVVSKLIDATLSGDGGDGTNTVAEKLKTPSPSISVSTPTKLASCSLVGGSPVICTHLLVWAKGGSTTITLLGGPSTLAVPTACTVDGGAPSGVGSKFELNNVFGVVRNTIFPRSVTL